MTLSNRYTTAALCLDVGIALSGGRLLRPNNDAANKALSLS